MDAEASRIVRHACKNLAVEDTLDSKMHLPASQSQPDQSQGMAGKPLSIDDVLEDGLTNELEELHGKLEKWAFLGRSTSAFPWHLAQTWAFGVTSTKGNPAGAFPWHLEGRWREFGGRQK